MSLFFVESPHTKEECAQALGDFASQNPDALKNFVWGCGHGNHTAWGIVEGRNENAVRSLVPASVRNKASVTEVDRMNAQQVKELLKMHAMHA